MTGPPADSVVIEFLRGTLANGALAVPELEIMAREAGLLSGSQSITHRKVFKRAKADLGIKSLRVGFGARSEWIWRLPGRTLAKSRSTASTDKRTPIPIDWIQGVARLDHHRPPNDVPRLRWHQFVQDCQHFLSSPENWAERAAQLGWDAVALFGCHPTRPLDYSGTAGLLWAMNGGRLVGLHRDWAVIDMPLQTRQRVFSRRNVEPTKISLPWTKKAA